MNDLNVIDRFLADFSRYIDSGFGLIGDIVVGFVGALVANWLFPALGMTMGGGWTGAILPSTIGAILVLGLLRLLGR